MKMPETLVVHEIYASIQGESSFAGVPCTFVRLTGCNLRCTYCDTEHAFYEGTKRTLRLSVGVSVPKLDPGALNSIAAYKVSAAQYLAQAQQASSQYRQLASQAQQASAKALNHFGAHGVRGHGGVAGPRRDCPAPGIQRRTPRTYSS